MAVIELTLPAPPSVNALTRNVPGKGRVKTDRYRTWLNAAGWAVKEQRPGRIDGEYSLSLFIRRPDRRKRDIANLIKATEDLLVAHQVIADDSLCVDVHAYWTRHGDDCRVVLRPVARAA